MECVEPSEIGALAAREGIPVLELAEEAPSLEDAYLRLTAEATTYASAAPQPQEV